MGDSHLANIEKEGETTIAKNTLKKNLILKINAKLMQNYTIFLRFLSTLVKYQLLKTSSLTRNYHNGAGGPDRKPDGEDQLGASGTYQTTNPAPFSPIGSSFGEEQRRGSFSQHISGLT